MLTLNHGLFSSPCFARMHKKLKGSMSRTAELKCPKGCWAHSAQYITGEVGWEPPTAAKEQAGSVGGEHLYGASLSFLVL